MEQFVFPTELRKQPFFAEIFKIEGGRGPPPRPMVTYLTCFRLDAILRLLRFAFSLQTKSLTFAALFLSPTPKTMLSVGKLHV